MFVAGLPGLAPCSSTAVVSGHVLFSTHLLQSAAPIEIWGCWLWSRSMVLGSADRTKPTLIIREIIFEEFQPM